MYRPRRARTLPTPDEVRLLPLDTVEFRSKNVVSHDKRRTRGRDVDHAGAWTPRGVVETRPDGTTRIWRHTDIRLRRVLREGTLVAEALYL